jgi:hypothetical protein
MVIHNPKVGGSIPPPATNLPIYFQRLTTNWRSGGESPYQFPNKSTPFVLIIDLFSLGSQPFSKGLAQEV